MKLFARAKRVVTGALEDNITGEAAKAAYYFFLSLFPMIMAGFALTGFLGGSTAFDVIMGWLQQLMPFEATRFMEQFVREVTDERRPEALTIGLLLAIWSGSNFFAAIGDGLDVMFDVRHRARWWKKRLKALLMLAVGGTLLFVIAITLLWGPQLAAWIGLAPYAHLLAWPLAFILLVGLLYMLYYIMPAHDQSRMKRELLIGAVTGTALWLISILIFRTYVTNIADYSRTYGFLGGIIILLLWLYITAVVILLGGEVADSLAQEKRERRDAQH